MGSVVLVSNMSNFEKKKHTRKKTKHCVRIRSIFLLIACLRTGLRIPLGFQLKELFLLFKVLNHILSSEFAEDFNFLGHNAMYSAEKSVAISEENVASIFSLL
jgi:hypothetical protein